MSSTPDFDLISTTRYAPCLRDTAWNTDANTGTPSPYLLLVYHRDRLLDAAKAHNWSCSTNLSLEHLESLCDQAIMTETGGSKLPEDNFRIRILLSSSGAVSVTASPTPPLPTNDPSALSLHLPPSPAVPFTSLLVIFLDNVPTPSTLFTRTKTTRRDHYTEARSRFGIPPPPTPSPHDVLLFNENGDITETSIRNVAFVRRSPPCWVTPAAATGCLSGVMRRWLLESGRVVEAAAGELTRDGIVEGEYVLTSNGVEGCRIGQVKFGRERPSQ
ncbi:aminotransferase [Lenzites betulinus]|nr:aminotransferase [Lenzites betulinus]